MATGMLQGEASRALPSGTWPLVENSERVLHMGPSCPVGPESVNVWSVVVLVTWSSVQVGSCRTRIEATVLRFQGGQSGGSVRSLGGDVRGGIMLWPSGRRQYWGAQFSGHTVGAD